MSKIWKTEPQGAFQATRWKKDIRGIVLPDIHYPAHDWRKLEMVFQAASDMKLDFGIQLGDLLDLSALGRWADGKPGSIEGERALEDFDHAGRFWDQFGEAVRANNNKAKLYALEGNHEKRVHDLCDKMPYFTGLFHWPNILDFDERKVTWVPSFSETCMLRFDWRDGGIESRLLRRTDWVSGMGIAFIHGWFCNVHHAKKTAERYGRALPIFYGHTHDVQLYTAHAFGWPRSFSGSLGHLRLADPEYVSSSDRWQPAFAVVDISAEEGVWDIHIIRITEDAAGNSHFFLNGKHYKSRKLHGTK